MVLILCMLIIAVHEIHAAEEVIDIEMKKEQSTRELTPRLPKEISKEMARKISIILTESNDATIERALYRTVSDDPKHDETELDHANDKRVQLFHSVSEVHDELNVDNSLKDQLSRWAIKELAARSNHEADCRKKESKKKIIASGIALITTIISIIGPIATFFITNNNAQYDCFNNTLM